VQRQHRLHVHQCDRRCHCAGRCVSVVTRRLTRVPQITDCTFSNNVNNGDALSVIRVDSPAAGVTVTVTVARTSFWGNRITIGSSAGSGAAIGMFSGTGGAIDASLSFGEFSNNTIVTTTDGSREGPSFTMGGPAPCRYQIVCSHKTA
jgi:hypothetical protein